ncbi:Lrp/AsnC family transcriptional regulator [Sphingobium sp. SCG-1]|uniref:Lrp/AsnC family transcriptional regulator n=1 Tax=Sphingobium sp. SCG-1 TaxID=2072936 RepID=UPI001CB9356F|nr:Lrp/AsnC family transcriptional regulator [Sphingobium sp. SCG-1]
MANDGRDPTGLDKLDLKILRSLSEDGRVTWSDLADRIGLTLTPTLKRVRRLEETGFIQGYTAKLDEARLKGTMVVFVSVTLERQVREALEEFEENIAALPEVMSGFLMSGGADYLLRVVVRDLEHYRMLLDSITRIHGVAHIQSSFALKAIVNRSAPMM